MAWKGAKQEIESAWRYQNKTQFPRARLFEEATALEEVKFDSKYTKNSRAFYFNQSA